MLYCPQCKTTYEEGKQRFCSNDNTRLLASGVNPASQQKSVFANVLKKTNPQFFDGAQTGKTSEAKDSFRVFQEPLTAESFQPGKENFAETFKAAVQPNVLEIKRETASTTKAGAPPKPSKPRLIRPNEVRISQAKLGDRTMNPTGRLALTWENTAILLGQTIKGRYFIVEQLSEDETSVAYLAEDKIVPYKKVVVRVLMEAKNADDLESKIFAEERVSLSHINHPHIAHLIDSGELLEGKSFIVSEYVEGVSLKEKLRTLGQFEARQAARIIRQVADALGEAHQNGVLHRNLKPENIILTPSVTGSEQIKVTDFAVFDGLDQPTEETLKYFSPEQLEGRLPNFASDIYTLGVIAYQMLTGRTPFNAASERELLKAQKKGLSLRPTNLRLDLAVQTDEVLEKALAYKPSERYSKAREFGDALYSALTTVSSLWDKPADIVYPITPPAEEILEIAEPETKKTAEPVQKKKEIFELIPETDEDTLEEKPVIVRGKILPPEDSTHSADAEEDSTDAEEYEIEETLEAETTPLQYEPQAAAVETLKAPEIALAEEISVAEKRKTATAKSSTFSGRQMFWAIGAVVLVAAILGMWLYFFNHSSVPSNTPGITAESTDSPANKVNDSATQPKVETPAPIEQVPPETQPRRIVQPPNTILFENSQKDLKGDLAKNFRGFAFYYPNDWVKSPGGENNFADVARLGATGTPIEQFLVSRYDSKGTFAADRNSFKEFAEKSKKDLESALNGKFQLLSEGETQINGWQVYEMKFQSEGVTKNGDKITLWGRRIWLPAANSDNHTGFILTLLATSISPEVKGADDVGVKGELAQVLSTFEPAAR